MMKKTTDDIVFVISTLKNPRDDTQLDMTDKVTIFVKTVPL